jgi:transaldolase/glucose-6-phosphate isomerase
VLEERLHLTTTLGYGPRFLHSTGQFHKGGRNTGLFIQLTTWPEPALPIPGEVYSFATFIRAQAQGDLEALRKHGRRVIRIDLGKDVAAGLSALAKAVDEALQPEAMR